jgi:hypothetical protein
MPTASRQLGNLTGSTATSVIITTCFSPKHATNAKVVGTPVHQSKAGVPRLPKNVLVFYMAVNIEATISTLEAGHVGRV